jgi:hypothetical protein
MYTILTRPVLAALALLLVRGSITRADEPKLDTPGIEVLTSGPIHEAYAQPSDSQPQVGPIAPKEPPPALDELPPEVKPQGDNVQWVSGYWQWSDDRNDFIWVSGFWRTPPPDRKWVPGYYAKAANGYQWVPGVWAPSAQRELAYQPQPPASVEDGPSVPPPSDDAIYNPGNWVYQDSQYRWRPGSYLAFRPGMVWIPAHYVLTPAGYLFVDGYWDYPLADRGLLFASVAADPSICFQPGFVYQPSYAYPADALTDCLFVRPGYGQYYAGDYYRRAGFTPFFDFRFARGAGFDPLYNYYRRIHAGQTWDRDLRARFAGRINGTIARPPRTLAQQANIANVRNAKLVVPLSQRGGLGVATTTISRQQAIATRQAVTQVRERSRQRGVVEARQATVPRVAVTAQPKPVVTSPSIRSVAPPQHVEVRPAAKIETHAPVIQHTTPPVARHVAAPVIRHDPPARTVQKAPVHTKVAAPPRAVQHTAAPRPKAAPAPKRAPAAAKHR